MDTQKPLEKDSWLGDGPWKSAGGILDGIWKFAEPAYPRFEPFTGQNRHSRRAQQARERASDRLGHAGEKQNQAERARKRRKTAKKALKQARKRG